MEIQSSEMFIQDPEYCVDYLKKRKVCDEFVLHFFENFSYGILSDATFTVEGESYEITHFLGRSNIIGFDIEKANEAISLTEGNDVALAVILGDDVISYDITTAKVYLYMIQSGDGEKILIDDSFEKFIKRVDGGETK